MEINPLDFLVLCNPGLLSNPCRERKILLEPEEPHGHLPKCVESRGVVTHVQSNNCLTRESQRLSHTFFVFPKTIPPARTICLQTTGKKTYLAKGRK
jgi:hypothetical protein